MNDEYLEKRLDRIERRLFPECLKPLYNYISYCPNPICGHDRWSVIDARNIIPEGKCSFCGTPLIIEDGSIREHNEIVFDN